MVVQRQPEFGCGRGEAAGGGVVGLARPRVALGWLWASTGPLAPSRIASVSIWRAAIRPGDVAFLRLDKAEQPARLIEAGDQQRLERRLREPESGQIGGIASRLKDRKHRLILPCSIAPLRFG